MATGRTFAEYIKDRCYNGLYQATEKYLSKNVHGKSLVPCQFPRSMR